MLAYSYVLLRYLMYVMMMYILQSVPYIIPDIGATRRRIWIGGKKVFGHWYWRGLLTSIIPGEGHPETHWTEKTHEQDCLFFLFDGLSSNDTGWDSWPFDCRK